VGSHPYATTARVAAASGSSYGSGIQTRASARLRHPSSGQLELLWRDPRRRRGGIEWGRAWPRLAAVAVGGVALGGIAGWATADPIAVTIAGLEDGAVLSAVEADELAVAIDVSGPGAGAVDVTVNGTPVEPEGDGFVIRPGPLLRDGGNELQVRVDGRLLFGGRTVTRRFEARLATADLVTSAQVLRPTDGEPLVVSGLVDDAVAVLVDGRPVDAHGGAFTVELPATVDAVAITAVHANGNVVDQTVAVVEDVAPVDVPETRAVHITARAWADPTLRAAARDLVRQGRINAVQLDIKDELGEIGYLSDVTIANRAGSVRDHYDVDEALAELHALDVRVIGRIVCFLDPVVAGWAWSEGRTDMVVQSADGSRPLDNDYGSAAFTNFASPDVQDYLIDLAVESAEAGFDEILYDYVRRPEGSLDTMTVPGLTRRPAVEVARFVRDSKEALAPYDVALGVSVFGIAATRPDQVAQDIALLAPNVDYVSPMVYPSHWNEGEYGVGDPNRQPGDIVERSLVDFRRAAAGSGAAVVPWLQAFSSGGVDYGPAEVQAQIDAAMAVGSSGYLLWNASSVYDPAALTPAS
jgi:hypothetical protein